MRVPVGRGMRQVVTYLAARGPEAVAERFAAPRAIRHPRVILYRRLTEEEKKRE